MADLRKLKDRAADLTAKGKYGKAAELLDEVVRADPRDVDARQRLAETLRKAGDPAGAVRVYREVADRYAAQGQLIKAVAICKVILEIEPAHEAMQAALAGLYARRARGDGATADVATAATAAPEVPAKSAAPRHVLVPPPPPRAPPAGSAEWTGTGETLPPTPIGRLVLQPLGAEVETGGLHFPPGPAPGSAFQSIVDTAREAAAAGVEDPLTRELRLELQALDAPRPADALPRAPAADLAAEALAEAAGGPVPTAMLPMAQVTGEAPLLAPAPAPAEPGARAAPPPEAGGAPAGELAKLPSIPLFSDLSREAFVELARQLALHRVDAGEVILREGDVGSSFFVIAAGLVRVEKATAGGPLLLARLGEGSFFGEMALLSGAQRVASVVAEETCVLLEIRAEVLQELTRAHPHVAESLTRFYRERLLDNALATSPLFRPFAREDRLGLMRRFRTRECAPGELLVREGEASDGLYVVLSGEVDVRKAGPRPGAEAPAAATGAPPGAADDGVLVARLGEGDVFGEMSCLRKTGATASVAVRRRATLLWLPRAAFDEVVLRYPPVLELVAELTDERQHALAALASRAAGDGPVLV